MAVEITGAIRLDEQRVGVSENAVFIPNLLHCAGVAVKLDWPGVGGQPPVPRFLGMHIYAATTSVGVDCMLQYVKNMLLPTMGTVAEVVVCLHKQSTDKYDVKSQDLLNRVEKTFGRPPRVLAKPDASTDMWLHSPASAANPSWIRTRSPRGSDYETPPGLNNTVRRLVDRPSPIPGIENLEMMEDGFPLLVLNPASYTLPAWTDVDINQLPTTL